MTQSQENGGERVSYWLVPAEPDKSRCSEIITALAKRFDAPIFEPHVTIYSGPFGASDDVAEVIESTALAFSEFTLRTECLAHSAQFTKTVFVQFFPDARLEALSERLKVRSRDRADYQLNPHLSLIYAPLPSAVREQLVRDLSLLPLMRFDELKVIKTGGPTQTRSDVEAWRVLASRKLAG
jgi:hypothetical protein